MALTYLQKQTALAKQIRKKHPKKIWTDCIKQAAAELKKTKKVGAYKVIEKGEPLNVKPKKVFQQTRTKKGVFKAGGLKRVAGYAAEGTQYKVRDMMEKDLQTAVKFVKYWKDSKENTVTFRRKMVSHYSSRVIALKKAVREQNKLINMLLK